MTRTEILRILAEPGASIDATWNDGARCDRIADALWIRPWLFNGRRDMVARLRGFTVERLIAEGIIAQSCRGQSGIRTYVLAERAQR